MAGNGRFRWAHEVSHGQWLAAQSDPEAMWGWATPAGRCRAARRADLIMSGAGLAAGMNVLEIGCGTGMFTEMFARSGAQVVAVDISPDLLERARARGLPADRVRFEEKRFEDCDVDGPFDAVIGSSVLHHLELDVSLSKMLALLRPGGRMCFAEPNYLNPQVFLERALRFFPWFSHVSRDETAFVRWPLRRRICQVGFEDVMIRPFDWLHPAIPGRLIICASSVGGVLEGVPLVREFSGSLLIVGKRPLTEDEKQ